VREREGKEKTVGFFKLLFGGLNCGAVVEVWEFWRVLVT
jgi:hypothetical protein